MKLFANTVSFLFHPLLMITIGIILAFNFTYLAIYPFKVKALIIGGTFLSTAVIPALFILLMIRTGSASDIELSDRKERALPYLIFISAILVNLYFLYKLMMPFWLLGILMGACIALILALCINFVWKISAHMIAIGGLLGAAMGISRIHMMNPYWSFMILFLIAGMLGTSRIYLKKHTPMQVYAGFTLGFACTFIASIWKYIYLFI